VATGTARRLTASRVEAAKGSGAAMLQLPSSGAGAAHPSVVTASANHTPKVLLTDGWLAGHSAADATTDRAHLSNEQPLNWPRGPPAV
jgi:hypothetical protein